jgi:hypothetical protein
MATGLWLSADLSPTLRAVRASRDTGGAIIVSFADYGMGWTDVTTGLSGARPCVRYDRLRGGLILAYESSSAIVRRASEDGATWGASMTIFSAGTYPTFCVTPTGVEHHFCVDSGAIKTRVLDAQGNGIIAATTVVASGVADDAIAAFERAGRVYLLYHDASGAIVTVSAADGVTYS